MVAGNPTIDGADGAGLSQLAHAESTAEVIDRYDGWAATGYEADLAEWGYEVPSVVASIVAEHLSADRAGSLTLPVMDAGCGTGLCGLALRAEGIDRLAGMDMSVKSLTLADERSIYGDLYEVDLTELPLPFPDNTFAAVTCAGVLTYLPDTAGILREFLRITAPGGAVIVSQRTDLWSERDCVNAIAGLIVDGLCDAEFSEPSPYLPGHPEYADDIQVIYTVLQVPKEP